MKTARGTGRLVAVALALAASTVLWGSAAGAAPDGSAKPLVQSAAVAPHRISLSKAAGTELRNFGVPAKGGYGFLLRLGTEATGRAYAANLSLGRSAAGMAAENQLASVRAAESRVIAALPSGTHVLYQTHALLAGVGVYTNVANLPALERIAGVTAVYPIAPKTPSLSYSTQLVHAPQVWATSTYGDRGENSTIAIIDTGVDYTHADLGGPGTAAAYQAARATDTAAPTYPDPNKILGGYDFVGDAYDAADPNKSTPVPDPNPLDCDSHGTHVAGIAAGYGENPDGSTFTGDYGTLPTDTAAYQALFRIGPGMAPKAKLYAYKVFGCTGSTDVITAAIDRAADPNGDGNPADHVNVINMSLGGDFASPQDADSVAANAAAQLGISVVAAAGNAGDLYDAVGSPGNATRVISVANSVDAYSQIDTLHATVNGGPQTYGAQRSADYTWASKPDLSGSVVKLTTASNLDGCDPITENLTGKIVFLEWTDNSDTRRCGSAARSLNAKNAGAIGVILGEDEETFAAGIAGSPDIPVVQVIKSAADAIRAALQASQPVTVTSTSAGDYTQLVSGDDDEVNSSSSRGIGDAGDVKPDVTGVGTSIFSSSMGTGNQGISFTGTSMASPEVAGLAALVLSQHPTWTAEEVKADIMNTADQDLFTGSSHSGTRYAPNRVGAGRIDAKAALDNNVVAYVANDPGAVGVSFGTVAAASPTQLTKTIDIVNKGASSATYAVSYDPITSLAGADYGVNPSSVTVGAGQTQSVTVTLTVTPSLLTKPIDPTVNRTQDTFARDYVADASGRVLFTSAGVPTLRVPVYSAPRPVSVMSQAASLKMPNGAVQRTLLPLSGAQLSQGSGLTAITSLVAGFELQATSPALPACGGSVTTGCIHAGDEQAADLKYVGTSSDALQLASIGVDPLKNGLAYFAITTQGQWRTPASANEYEIYIDSNGDGKADAVLLNDRLPDTDVFVSVLVDPTTDDVLDVEAIDDRLGDTDAAVFGSDTLVLPVAISALPGVTATSSRITYGVVTFSSFAADPVDSVGFNSSFGLDGSLSMDVLRPGLAVFGSYTGVGSPLLYGDQSGKAVQVIREASSYAADHGQGALIVHFQNAVGNKAQVVDLGHDLLVTRSGFGGGTVRSSPGGVSCGKTCVGSFATGTSVKLTAKPSAVSTFGHWSGGGCSGKAACHVMLNSDVSVTAVFNRDRTKPKVTLVKVKVNHRTGTARVRFHGTDPVHGRKGLRFKCKLDRSKRFASCRSPKLYKHLRHGRHVIQVKAIDKAGNISKPVKRKFRV
ncbi:MAG TPA: S8 family serine peptidase [Gaiellaceae bacterium]|nr:S8 family serine peptidase [Gaiellaceae bacterium]